MRKKRVTSTDIAKEAGVSQATVSMILNKKYNVSFSKDTIKRVEEVAATLGYNTPKRTIRKDSKGQKLIVVFCPTLTNPYYVMLLQGIEEVAKENGYGIFVCNTERDLKIEERYLKMMKYIQPQGIIYTCYTGFVRLVESLAESIPVVVIGNKDESFDIDVVELNNKKTGVLMARHLLELGHRKVAFISTPLIERQPTRVKRVDGFVREFEKVGMQDSVIVKSNYHESDVIMPSVDSEYSLGYELTKELMYEHSDITAIAGLNDMIALGIMDALLHMKYKIPSDVSVLGCDNIVFGRLHSIALTTVEHFVSLKGRDACDITIKKIMSQNSYHMDMKPISIYHIEYEPKLIVRGTTAYSKNK